MTIQTINIGTTANDGTGDPLRTALDKVNDNFTDTTNAASRLVTTSTTDTTAGRLLKVGDGGLLRLGFTNNRDMSTPIYPDGFGASFDIAPVDSPFTTGSCFTIEIGSESTAPTCQLAISQASGSNRMAFRSSASTDSWQEILHTGNTGSIVTEDRINSTGTLAYSAGYGMSATSLTVGDIEYNEIAGSVTGEVRIQTDSSDNVEVGDMLAVSGFAYPHPSTGAAFQSIGTFFLYLAIGSQQFATGVITRDTNGLLLLSIESVKGTPNWGNVIRGSFSLLN